MSPSDSSSMVSRYELEVNNRDPAIIVDLNLDNCSAKKISGLSDKLVNLQSLSIINAGLESLDGLPVLPSLLKLDLSNNQLFDGLDIIAKNCPQLLHLNLSGNSFEGFEDFKNLRDTSVVEIDIFSNPLSADATHREKIFALLPTLQILDGCDHNGVEVQDEEDEHDITAEDSENEIVTDEEEGDDEAASDEEEDGPGLSYLNKSQFSDDEEDEDYDPEMRENRKRAIANSEADEEEPPAKKEA